MLLPDWIQMCKNGNKSCKKIKPISTLTLSDNCRLVKAHQRYSENSSLTLYFIWPFNKRGQVQIHFAYLLNIWFEAPFKLMPFFVRFPQSCVFYTKYSTFPKTILFSKQSLIIPYYNHYFINSHYLHVYPYCKHIIVTFLIVMCYTYYHIIRINKVNSTVAILTDQS